MKFKLRIRVQGQGPLERCDAIEWAEGETKRGVVEATAKRYRHAYPRCRKVTIDAVEEVR